MTPDERQFVRVMSIALSIVYVIGVGVFALLKAVLGLEALPWAEVAYGPAITVTSIFLIYLGAIGLNHLTRPRGGGK